MGVEFRKGGSNQQDQSILGLETMALENRMEVPIADPYRPLSHTLLQML